MTIYTIIGSTDRTEWISKSFTCERTATEFCRECLNIVRAARCLEDILMFSPDPTVHLDVIKRNLGGRRVYYTVQSNELVTDAFMELTLQPHKPRNKFNKEFL